MGIVGRPVHPLVLLMVSHGSGEGLSAKRRRSNVSGQRVSIVWLMHVTAFPNVKEER